MQSPRQSAELDGALAIRIPSLATALIALPLLGYSTGEQIETSALVSAAAAGVLIGFPTAALLRCFRGVDAVTAMTVLAELGDVTRFGGSRQLMLYLGLTPSECSSGASQRRGEITKGGGGRLWTPRALGECRLLRLPSTVD